MTPDTTYGQVQAIRNENTTLTLGDIICITATEYNENKSEFGYRDIQGNIMGVYAYRSKYLPVTDGRTQSELKKDLHFRMTTAYEHMATRFSQTRLCTHYT